MRAWWLIFMLLLVAAKQPGCEIDFLRLVDHLATKGNRLTTEHLGALAQSPTAVNPAEMLELTESAKQAWRKVFAASMNRRGFKWESVREALAQRVAVATGENEARDVARAETAPVLSPWFVRAIDPNISFTPNSFHRAKRVGDKLYVPKFPGSLVEINLVTLAAKDLAIPGTVVEINGQAHAVHSGQMVNLRTKRPFALWPETHSKGAVSARFGTRDVVFARADSNLRIRSVDRRKKIESYFQITKESSLPAVGEVGGEKVIVFYEGDSGDKHTSQRVILARPGGHHSTIHARLEGAPSPAALFDAGRSAVFSTREGFHFVDIENAKDAELVKVQRMVSGPLPQAVQIIDGVGAAPSDVGVALVDLRGRKLIQEVRSARVTSEIGQFEVEGERYFAWGDNNGNVTIADTGGVILATSKVSAGRITSFVPFSRDGKVMAIVAGEAPPALVQLYGALGAESSP